MDINQKINFSIKKALVENSLLCPELLLYFVIDGSASIKIQERTYQLGPEECVIVNFGTVHSISSTSETLIAIVRISATLLIETAKERNYLFLFHSNFQKNSTYYEMVRIIRRLIYTDIYSDKKSNSMILSILFELMDFLMEHYVLDTYKLTASQNNDDLRIAQLMQYVNQNYKENISLSTVADELFVSKSTLSRLFKKRTGIYFADYVNQVRIRSSVQELLHTEKTITRIAMDNGFSNPSTFHRIFSNYYHISPSIFRKEQKESILSLEEQNNKLRDQLRIGMREKKHLSEDFKLVEKLKTTVDVNTGTPLNKVWKKAINIGSVFDMTRANMQQHTLYLTQHLRYSHIRMWNVFSKQMMITDGSSSRYYNYENLDVVLDFLYKNKISPFFDLGNRPTTALYSVNSPVYFQDDCVSFQTLEDWSSAIISLINHIITRYGIEIVNDWIFELSINPFHGNSFQYYKENFSYKDIYREFYRIFKTLLPNAKIGGIMYIPNGMEQNLIQAIHYCSDNNLIPDFVGIALFPYDTIRSEEDGSFTSYRTIKKDYELEKVWKFRSILDQVAPECMLFVDEINNTLSNRNFLNDSCFRATYYARVFSEIAPYVDMICPWMGSDWVSNYYDTRSIINGGSGILTKDSMRKPAYYAIAFMNFLGETLIERGSNYIITSKGGRSYYILCFNYKEYNSNFYLQDENIEDPEDIFKLFQDANPIEVNFTLEGLPDDTKYIIKRRTVNPWEGTLLYIWRQFEYEQDLSANDIQYLKDICQPTVRTTSITTVGGKLPIKITLQNQEISLLHIYKSL